MKQQVSALMDGELFDDEAEGVLNSLKRNGEMQEDWKLYHLIGDALRQPDHVHADISPAMHERLEAEPTVLAPRTRTREQRAKVYALSAAASLLAVGVVAWMSVQISPERAPQLAVQQQENVRPASMRMERDMNDYLNAHQDLIGDVLDDEDAPKARAAVVKQ